jgi:penicillin amidase
VHLSGEIFNVAGMAYVGMPAVMFGRTVEVAWGLTNNICSQRDLYQERTSAENPGCFLFDGNWEPARELTETIFVRGSEPVTRTIRFSRNGPIVDEILQPPGNKTGPVSLKWLGAHHGGWLTALLNMDCAQDAAGLRDALYPWYVPTFSAVFGDVDGYVGYQAAGRLPVRNTVERGYREGWNPEHQWQGLVPFRGCQWRSPPSVAGWRPPTTDLPRMIFLILWPAAGSAGTGPNASATRSNPPRAGFKPRPLS